VSSDTVEVSVLIPVLDEERHLTDAIASVLGQTLTGSAEFLFIDGGSEDGSVAILEEHAARVPRLRVLHNPQRRTPNALNIGLRAARGTYVARMDAHAHYPPDYLRIGMQRLRRGDVVSVSGPQLAVGDGRWSQRVALALDSPLGVGGARFRRMSHGEIEVDSGFTGMWRREVLVAQGGWDEDWVNDQDLELAARLREAGGRIVCLPEMAASYIPRDSVRGLARQYWRYGFYRVKTSRRHPESLRPSQVLPPLLTLTMTLAVIPSRPVAPIARAALVVYGLALLASTAMSARGTSPREAAPLPVVYLAMHVPYGAGFLMGCGRWGPPLRALALGALRAGMRRR
jgi:glycosyltransferase involved in cell wall biosynthesis